jgi:hypothetical protein
MGMTQGQVAVGVFANPVQARRAVDELHRAGYSGEEIGYLTRASANRPSEDTGTFIANSAVEGGLVGGLIGAAAALLIPGIGPVLAGGILAAALGGAAIGAAAGGVIAALVNIGVPEDEAHFYQKELEAGRTIVTVKSPTGYADALNILRRNGAYDAGTQFSEFNARPPIRPYGSAEPGDTGDNDTQS